MRCGCNLYIGGSFCVCVTSSARHWEADVGMCAYVCVHLSLSLSLSLSLLWMHRPASHWEADNVRCPPHTSRAPPWCELRGTAHPLALGTAAGATLLTRSPADFVRVLRVRASVCGYEGMCECTCACTYARARMRSGRGWGGSVYTHKQLACAMQICFIPMNFGTYCARTARERAHSCIRAHVETENMVRESAGGNIYIDTYKYMYCLLLLPLSLSQCLYIYICI